MPHTTLIMSQSMAGTTSPNWRFLMRYPRGVAGGYDQCSTGQFPSTTTPGTATTVPSPNEMWIRGVPCHAYWFAQNMRSSLMENCETGACTPAASTPGESVVVSSPLTEKWPTVAGLADRTHRSNPQALRHETPWASLWPQVRALGHYP